MNNDEVKNVKLRVESCFKQFDESFNRVKYFSCISDNLKETDLPLDWSIQNPNSISYGMGNPDNLDYILKGYQHFIQRYLVRDCIESFSLSLDELFFALTINGKRFRPNQSIKEGLSESEFASITSFQWKGLSDKVRKLESLYDLILSAEHKELIDSLKDIRNCFAHSNGIVRPIDGKECNHGRKFKWKSFHVFLQGVDSGEKLALEIGVPLKEASNVCVQFVEYSRSFKVGESMSFSSKETYEIAWSLQMVGLDYIQMLNKKLNNAELVKNAG